MSTNVDVALGRVADQCAGGLRAAGMWLELELPQVPLPVAADAQRLEQVFRELIEGTIKIGQPGGRIMLCAARRGRTVCVRIETRAGSMPLAPQGLTGEMPQLAPVARTGRSGREAQHLRLVRQSIARLGGSLRADAAGPLSSQGCVELELQLLELGAKEPPRQTRV